MEQENGLIENNGTPVTSWYVFLSCNPGVPTVSLAMPYCLKYRRAFAVIRFNNTRVRDAGAELSAKNILTVTSLSKQHTNKRRTMMNRWVVSWSASQSRPSSAPSLAYQESVSVSHWCWCYLDSFSTPRAVFVGPLNPITRPSSYQASVKWSLWKSGGVEKLCVCLCVLVRINKNKKFKIILENERA